MHEMSLDGSGRIQAAGRGVPFPQFILFLNLADQID